MNQEPKLDILGNEVRIGDTVRFMQLKYRSFMDGVIETMAPLSALIKHEEFFGRWKGETRQRYDQMISISALERNGYIQSKEASHD